MYCNPNEKGWFNSEDVEMLVEQLISLAGDLLSLEELTAIRRTFSGVEEPIPNELAEKIEVLVSEGNGHNGHNIPQMINAASVLNVWGFRECAESDEWPTYEELAQYFIENPKSNGAKWFREKHSAA